MNNIQIEQFDKRLRELGKFTQDRDGGYKETEIIDWIADCTNLFYEVGVDSVAIRHFLDYFNFRIEEVKINNDMVIFPGHNDRFEKVRVIGPFQEEYNDDGFFRRKTGNYILAGSFYYARVAFSAAKNTLKRKIEEKRLVPFWLVEQTATQDKLKHLTSSLELIENKYEQRDAHGLVTESITLLDSVLNLDEDLKTKDSIGGKLNSLIENESKRQSFGVSRDLVVGLNSGRILRNEKVIHKEAPLKYEIPFLIATSFAYLVLFFVECAILNGKVIHYEN
ncbi:hypothetical protein HYV91_01990 [Candidatus Wolfebacteria bacterium]|nr:hypothetical protein [Candidatus Wolfebacteria bacterium]